MRDQKCSNHTLILISPLQEKHPQARILCYFAPKFIPKQAFLEDKFDRVWKMTLNTLNIIQKDPFSKKIGTFWPPIAICAKHV